MRAVLLGACVWWGLAAAGAAESQEAGPGAAAPLPPPGYGSL